MGRQLETIIDSLGTVTLGTLNASINLTPVTNDTTAILADTAAMDSNLASLTTDVANGIIVTNATAVVTSGTVVVTTGTVTANGGDFVGEQSDAVAPSKIVQIGWYDDNNGEFLRTSDNSRFPVGNGILESVVKSIGSVIGNSAVAVAFDNGGLAQIPSATNPLPISGTVTANPVRGTTTIGTLTAGTTNGTLFATNSTRNYLLVQCTSGTAFIDTNGTATAANGIQLTSGQGITFEGSFIPTGAIAGITSTGTAQLIGRQG